MQSLNELLRRPALLVWWMYVLATPFYVAPSGLPQPGDALIFLLVPVSLAGWNGRLSRSLTLPLRPLIWFLIWVFVVNYTWAVVLWKFDRFTNYLGYPIFYTFNALVLLCALINYQRYRDLFLRVTINAVMITILIQVVASFFMGPSGLSNRLTLFFNSPNQLGYYALLSACLIVITQRRLGSPILMSALGVTGCAYLALLAASRASLVAIAVLMLLLLFSNPRIIIVASLAALALLYAGGPITKAIDQTEQRGTTTKDSGFAEERAYDRLWKFKQHLIVGAGEGDFRRFDNRLEAREIHSSFATLWFSYGVVGILLFLAFLARVVRGSSFRLKLMLVPILVYTIAHQGLRFTMLWVILAVFMTLRDQTRTASSRPVAHRSQDPQLAAVGT
jgi:hypothetical protein